MQTTTFDPTSPEYQVSPDFPPDKTKTYEYPPEEDAWTLVHNAIRGEIEDIKGAIDVLRKRETLEPWMMTSLLSMCKVHSIHIHSHHENEDDILAPELNKRFKYPDKHVEDHVGLVKGLDIVMELVEELASKDCDYKAKLEMLSKAVASYEHILLPHLKEEEDLGLLLTRAYFTHAEIGKIVEKIMVKAPPVEIGSIVHYMGVEKFRKEFMRREGIPFFVWYLSFKKMYGAFVHDFTLQYEAIKAGKPLPKHHAGLFASYFRG